MTTLTEECELEDVTLRAFVSGPPEGPLALCLHGFPDTPHTYRFLAPYLVERGFRVVAPFSRGYAPSSLPRSESYHIADLAHDAIGLYDHFGGDERAIIIGHDWGASAAYVATNAEPARWRRAVTMSVPPLLLFAEALSNFDQLRMSWYMFYFQQSFANKEVERDDLDFLRRLWTDWSPGYQPDDDLDYVRSALGHRENLTAALGYYRAMFSSAPLSSPAVQALANAAFSAPSIPTLYLHGEHDGCIAPSLSRTRTRVARPRFSDPPHTPRGTLPSARAT